MSLSPYPRRRDTECNYSARSEGKVSRKNCKLWEEARSAMIGLQSSSLSWSQRSKREQWLGGWYRASTRASSVVQPSQYVSNQLRICLTSGSLGSSEGWGAKTILTGPEVSHFKPAAAGPSATCGLSGLSKYCEVPRWCQWIGLQLSSYSAY